VIPYLDEADAGPGDLLFCWWRPNPGNPDAPLAPNGWTFLGYEDGRAVAMRWATGGGDDRAWFDGSEARWRRMPSAEVARLQREQLSDVVARSSAVED
jgi:hypothetical protein